ncbi:MAG: metal ABC transporter substrate-binding protein [Clostridiales bacterium]|nr:metal ABC transporter substrate-binding protein [Clostridiales bacterium]
MKKIISVFMAVCFVAGSLSACSAPTQAANSDKISIVTTIFPPYDWTREILGERMENTELTMLMDTGVDLHSYQPTADDMVKISACDMFIYVGGESDEWVADALKEATNEDMIVINLLDVLGDAVKEEEWIEGMEPEDEHAHEEEGHEGEGHEEEGDANMHDEGHAADEHVWLSLKNAASLCSHLADALGRMDSAHADEYRANADAYIKHLSELDGKYEEVVASATQRTLLFADRFPCRYLVDDYGIDYYAAFAGCSAETEASFETIAFLAQKVDELGLTNVLTIEGSNQKIADTVINNTTEKNQKVLVLDSLQSITAADVKNGATYFAIMEENLEVLKAALK